jgi:hypothetical protein
VTARLVRLVDDHGLDTIADLWSGRPARSLPGALWRLYVVREWVRRDPVGASCDYAAGYVVAEVPHVVAGVAQPPGADEVRALADAVLTGVYAGELDVALERAGAFCRVVAAGRAIGRTTTLTRQQPPHRPDALPRCSRRLRSGGGSPCLARIGLDLRHCPGSLGSTRASGCGSPGSQMEPLRAAVRREALPARRPFPLP